MNPLKMYRIGDDTDFIVYRKGSGRSVEIYDIQVNSCRRKGRGRSLILQLIGSLTKGTESPEGITLLTATTRWSNIIAQEFYEALGFHIIGRLHYYYVDGPNERTWEHGVMYGMKL